MSIISPETVDRSASFRVSSPMWCMRSRQVSLPKRFQHDKAEASILASYLSSVKPLSVPVQTKLFRRDQVNRMDVDALASFQHCLSTENIYLDNNSILNSLNPNEPSILMIQDFPNAADHALTSEVSKSWNAFSKTDKWITKYESTVITRHLSQWWDNYQDQYKPQELILQQKGSSFAKFPTDGVVELTKKQSFKEWKKYLSGDLGEGFFCPAGWSLGICAIEPFSPTNNGSVANSSFVRSWSNRTISLDIAKPWDPEFIAQEASLFFQNIKTPFSLTVISPNGIAVLSLENRLIDLVQNNQLSPFLLHVPDLLVGWSPTTTLLTAITGYETHGVIDLSENKSVSLTLAVTKK